MIENVIVFAILVLIIGAVGFYLYRAKKKGQTCVGCPCAKECSRKCREKELSDVHNVT